MYGTAFSELTAAQREDVAAAMRGSVLVTIWKFP